MKEIMTKWEKDFKRYNKIITIWEHWDKGYWTSFHIFIIINGLLFAGFTQVIQRTIVIAFIFCVAGVIINFIWMFILNGKLAHMYKAQELGKELESNIFIDSKGCFTEIEKFKNNPYLLKNHLKGSQVLFASQSTGYYSAYLFPIIVIIIWFSLLVVTFVYGILDLIHICYYHLTNFNGIINICLVI